MDVASSVGSFAVVAGLLTIIPGPDTAIVLRSSLAHGQRVGLATAVGINSGVMLWGAAAAVGISALLTASQTAYTTLRIAGAIYLCWMGVGLLRTAWRNKGNAIDVVDDGESVSLRRAWLRGLMTNVLNPKIGVFYMAVLPQFIPPDTSQILMGLLLASVHNLEGMIWFATLIVLSHMARRWLQQRRVQRSVDGITGSVLLGFGAKVALSDH